MTTENQAPEGAPLISESAKPMTARRAESQPPVQRGQS
jgi:hypothetical protein